MIVRVLGSAAGGGVPQWNCRCANCDAVRAGAAPSRMQASIAISPDGAQWVLVNATTDVRAQMARLPAPAGNARRASPVGAVLLTDANIDHAAGLLEFRQAPSLRIFSSATVRDVITGGNSMFAPLTRGQRQWSMFECDGGACDVPGVLAGLDVRAIDLPGLLPSFAGGTEVPGAATAFVFEGLSRSKRVVRIVYAPIFLRVSDALLQAADGADAVFLDGSFWSDDELPSLGLATRSARAMGHAAIDGDGGSLRAFAGRARVAGMHRYYTHVNNSNPVLDPSAPAAIALREAGFSVVSDGAELDFDDA